MRGGRIESPYQPTALAGNCLSRDNIAPRVMGRPDAKEAKMKQEVHHLIEQHGRIHEEGLDSISRGSVYRLTLKIH